MDKYHLAENEYSSGDKISLEEALLIRVDLDEALSINPSTGDSSIKCPRNCGGTLVIQPSRNGYGPYVGCNSKACNFYTTVKKIKDREAEIQSKHNNE